MFGLFAVIIISVIVGLELINLDVIDDGIFYTVKEPKHCFSL